ncbi:MAG: diguanylate cyclase [Gammaproteobacteria bacterium]|nr:diguanylate cyclase [Gammaproteobacteria bacterium]
MSNQKGMLIEQFHYDPLKRQRALEILGVNLQDFHIIHEIHNEFLDDNIDRIVDRFYLSLWQHEEFKSWLKNSRRLNAIKLALVKYLYSLGIACDGERYFETRLRIGLVHAQIGLPLSYYISACNILRTQILESIPSEIQKDIKGYHRVQKMISALLTLDMNLAIEAYHMSEVKKLSSTVASLQSESSHLRQRAQHDALTGLHNHHEIAKLLDQAMEDVPNDHALCLIMADLDHFKRVNDTHGHLTGDAVLKGLANRLKHAMRAFDHIGRYGGEEFMIILQNTDLDEGREIAERLRQSVNHAPFHSEVGPILMGISMGLTQYRLGDTRQSFIERADKALYKAKHTGRNRVTIIT